jgi:hypothetical protein
MKTSEITCAGLVCGEGVDAELARKYNRGEAVALAVAFVLAGMVGTGLALLGYRYQTPLPLEAWGYPLSMLGYFLGLAG